MSRELNKKQKNMIMAWINKNWAGAGSIYTCNQMQDDLLQSIVDVNDHETVYQNMDRFINDVTLEKVYR
jgi:hypothetical protein